jgi:hypothetical protein
VAGLKHGHRRWKHLALAGCAWVILSLTGVVSPQYYDKVFTYSQAGGRSFAAVLDSLLLGCPMFVPHGRTWGSSVLFLVYPLAPRTRSSDINRPAPAPRIAIQPLNSTIRWITLRLQSPACYHSPCLPALSIEVLALFTPSFEGPAPALSGSLEVRPARVYETSYP